MTIDTQWLDTHEWMLRSSNDGKSHDGYTWPLLGQWATASDWNDRAECGGGFHGNAPEAHGAGFFYSRLELVETRGPRIVIDGDKIKVRSARIVAVNEDIPLEAFARCGYTLHVPHDGETISPRKDEIWLVKGITVSVVGQTGGYCRACSGGTVNSTGQTGGYCRADSGGTVNSTSQTGGDCWADSGGTVNKKGGAA